MISSKHNCNRRVKTAASVWLFIYSYERCNTVNAPQHRLQAEAVFNFQIFTFALSFTIEIACIHNPITRVNSWPLIGRRLLYWRQLIGATSSFLVAFWRRNDVTFDDVTINNVTLLDEPTKGRVLGTKWLLKRMRKLYVSLYFDPIF